MIHLFDGMNVMRRAIEKPMVGAAMPLSLRQRYEATNAAHMWFWDGMNHNERRRKVYPPYKMNREPAAENIYAHVKLWKQLLSYSQAPQIEVPGWEADDAIATMARHLSSGGRHCTIHSNDMDYAQLDGSPFIHLDGVNTRGVPPRWVALYKAMVGDKSDNIAGVPGFGHKRWEEMEEHWPQIERAIVNGHAAGFVNLPFKPAVLAWLMDETNVKLLQSMLLVTHFENVPWPEMNRGTTEGEYNRESAHALLREFFL